MSRKIGSDKKNLRTQKYVFKSPSKQEHKTYFAQKNYQNDAAKSIKTKPKRFKPSKERKKEKKRYTENGVGGFKFKKKIGTRKNNGNKT